MQSFVDGSPEQRIYELFRMLDRDHTGFIDRSSTQYTPAQYTSATAVNQ